MNFIFQFRAFVVRLRKIWFPWTTMCQLFWITLYRGRSVLDSQANGMPSVSSTFSAIENEFLVSKRSAPWFDVTIHCRLSFFVHPAPSFQPRILLMGKVWFRAFSGAAWSSFISRSDHRWNVLGPSNTYPRNIYKRSNEYGWITFAWDGFDRLWKHASSFFCNFKINHFELPAYLVNPRSLDRVERGLQTL